MFTGIVETVGRVVDVKDETGSTTMVIDAPPITDGLVLGDSVNVDGACLTVTQLAGERFAVGLSPETLRRTNLGERRSGESVNLERAVLAGARIGGHYVQGHVDGVGRLLERADDGSALRLRISAPASLMPYIVEKGFIGMDGISLTVTGRGEDWFTVMLIPYTRQAVTLADKQAGESVNLEVDVIAKYVESLLEGRFDRHS